MYPGNPGGLPTPTMPSGPGVPVQPGQPGPSGVELPGFQSYVQNALRGILANPNASLTAEAVDGYTVLAIAYARSYIKHMAEG